MGVEYETRKKNHLGKLIKYYLASHPEGIIISMPKRNGKHLYFICIYMVQIFILPPWLDPLLCFFAVFCLIGAPES